MTTKTTKLAKDKTKKKNWWQMLGPGLITGASDNDPSGIATYSQAGAQFGFGLLWTMLFSYPLMSSIQDISAEIGRVTGYGYRWKFTSLLSSVDYLWDYRLNGNREYDQFRCRY